MTPGRGQVPAFRADPARQLPLDPVARLARVAADDEPQLAGRSLRMARTSAAPSLATVS